MTSSNGLSALETLRAALITESTVSIYGTEVTFKLLIPDPAEFLRDMKMGNPIREALEDAMRIIGEKSNGKGQFEFTVAAFFGDYAPIISKALSDNDTFNNALENVNRTLHNAIIDPKLPEPGTDDLSIENIPITAKVKMLTDMYGGGDLLNGLKIFRNGQASTVLTRPKGEKVRDAAKPDDGD